VEWEAAPVRLGFATEEYLFDLEFHSEISAQPATEYGFQALPLRIAKRGELHRYEETVRGVIFEKFREGAPEDGGALTLRPPHKPFFIIFRIELRQRWVARVVNAKPNDWIVDQQ
jgi:hypothetical protein